jgi:hypothetical protein
VWAYRSGSSLRWDEDDADEPCEDWFDDDPQYWFGFVGPRRVEVTADGGATAIRLPQPETIELYPPPYRPGVDPADDPMPWVRVTPAAAAGSPWWAKDRANHFVALTGRLHLLPGAYTVTMIRPNDPDTPLATMALSFTAGSAPAAISGSLDPASLRIGD